MVLSGAHAALIVMKVQWRLARALFFLGQQSGSPDSGRAALRRGDCAGERAVALNDHRVEGHFWVGVNLACLLKPTAASEAHERFAWRGSS